MSDAIDRIASDWLIRRDAGELREADERRLAQWLDADPAHRRAFEALERVWDELGDTPELAALETEKPRRSSLLGWGVGAGALAAAIALAAVLLPVDRTNTTDTVATRVAEQRELRLADGSVATLAPDSELVFALDGPERRVTLKRGEAFFAVAHDPARPFLVTAGDTEIRVVGTKFDVKHGVGTVQVGVAEGLVEVRRNAEPRLLTAGQLLVLAPQRAPEFQPVAAVPAGAWRAGRLAYADARLVEVVADANRYFANQLVLATPDLAQLRVTASFQTGQAAQLIEALTTALPLKAERMPDGKILLSRRIN